MITSVHNLHTASKNFIIENLLINRIQMRRAFFFLLLSGQHFTQIIKIYNQYYIDSQL